MVNCLSVRKCSFPVMMLLAVFFVIALSGCKTSKDALLVEMDAIYLDIKTVVTDPDVEPLISVDKMERLKKAEQLYLKAVRVLKSLDNFENTDGQLSLEDISSCADTILSIIDSLDVYGRYGPEIAAARISLKVLKNHISR